MIFDQDHELLRKMRDQAMEAKNELREQQGLPPIPFSKREIYWQHVWPYVFGTSVVVVACVGIAALLRELL